MGIMAIGWIIFLSTLFIQTLSAPSACIESCNTYHTSYQNHRTSSGTSSGTSQFQDHASLVQSSTNLNHHDYARPGNWTEHNQYSTDGGHGKVHEERGQYVEGSKKVRYYKKNFTSSYGNMNGMDAREFDELRNRHRYDSMRIPSNQHFDSQNTQIGQTVQGREQRMHSQQTQSSSTRIDSRNERLEDFGEYHGQSQINQRIPIVDSQTIETQHRIGDSPSNWSRVDSYKTDGGHGRVFEEEGQYITGPKKVRYYKKNYTSSYGTSSVPQTNIGSTTLNELHREMERNLHKELDNMRKEFHQTSSVGHTASTHTDTVGLAQETVNLSDLQTAESDNNYRQQLSYGHVPSTGTVHHYTDQQHRETITDTRQRLPYVYPTANTYGSNNQRTYESRETYTSHVRPSHQPSQSLSSYIQVPDIHGTHSSYQTNLHNTHSRGSSHVIDESQRREIIGTHQSSVAQNELLTGSSQHAYNSNPSYGTHPSRIGETRHYEERWSTSGHTGGNLAPEHIGHLTDRAHYDRIAYNEHRGRYHGTHQGYDTRARTSESYNSAHRTNTEQLVTGSLNLGHAAHGADCTEETQHYQQETRYHRKYKRDDHHGRYDAQPNQAFSQKLQQIKDMQQIEDLPQQSEQFTQQTANQSAFKESNINNQHLEDLTQQTQQSDSIQQSDKLEFGQETVDDQYINQHNLEDLTQQSEQQIEGEFEFGQQTVGNQQHVEDLTQQNDQHTQQVEKFDDFTVNDQHINNHHLEDLTQQSEQHTQQIEGEFEFGQETIANQQHLEDLTQQNEQHTQQVEKFDDFMQQTSGKLEFGQQTINDQYINNHHLKDLTRQNEFTQQTENQFKLGQQTVNNQNSQYLMQKVEHPAQQTAKSDDLIQRTTGTFEFGQRTLDDHHPKNLIQKDKFIQQTGSQLKFGQHTIDNQYSDDLTQQKNEQFTQGFDDFTQQKSGKLEFGQQVQPIDKSTRLINHFEKFGQQNEHLTQQTGKFDEFTQQTMGRLEFEQESQEFDKPKIRNQYLKDFAQQDKDLNQQTEGLEQWQLQQTSQKMDLNHHFTQQSNYDQSTTDIIKPASKPRLRQRHEKHNSTSQYIDGTHANLNVFKVTDADNNHKEIIQHINHAQHYNTNGRLEILNQQSQRSSVFDNQKENMDRLHWVHKSNDATVGLQWHYTYHPSDLTNVQGEHDSYYPHRNINSQQTEDLQQQSRPFDFNQQETQHTFENAHLNLYDPQLSQHNKNNQQSEAIQQIEISHFNNQQNQNLKETSLGVIPLQHNQDIQQTTELDKQSQSTTQTEYKLEPRILQAYGGGPYDKSRNEDIYNKVTINPSATLPPIYGEDPWDVREKPRYIIPWTAVNTNSKPNSKPKAITTTEMIETTTQMIQTTSEEATPSFWNRLSHKISNTYDKAKEKAKEIFG
jgi:hypothetical protein